MSGGLLIIGAALGGVFPSTAALTLPACTCSKASLCAPLSTPLPRTEVFGFMSSAPPANFNWTSGVTTVAWNTEPSFICAAHEHGVRVVASHGAAGKGFNITALGLDAAARKAWIAALITYVKAHFLDGVTFDFESPLATRAPEVAWYAEIVAETRAALRKEVGAATQSSVCAAWSPDCIDGRCYDYVALANASDFLYVMGYDTRSQIFDACVGFANAALPLMQRGLNRFLEIGVPSSKLVLGTPWYGYDYKCLADDVDDDDDDRLGRGGGGVEAVARAVTGAAMKTKSSLSTTMKKKERKPCRLPYVPFRGVNCSDAAGHEVGFASIIAMVDAGKTVGGRQWDEDSSTPFYDYIASDGSRHQRWYDDEVSSAAKYELAISMRLRGVGPFEYSDLGSDTPAATQHAAKMWGALKEYVVHA